MIRKNVGDIAGDDTKDTQFLLRIGTRYALIVALKAGINKMLLLSPIGIPDSTHQWLAVTTYSSPVF